jgi:hypothetical protein
MRNLTPTLLGTQQEASRIPYVKVEASSKIAGVVRLDWERLYTGSEADYFHALSMPGDGSLIRARITPPDDTRKLYRQRVADPNPSSDFSSWTNTNQYNCLVVAAASSGAEVSIFWINSSREIRHLKSTDYGVSWGSPVLIDYSPTTGVNGLAAAYKTNGDLAIFFADQQTLYVKKRVGGSWQSKTAWDKSTGSLSGVAAVYDADWNLAVSGIDSTGNFKLWSLVYGDGGDVSPGSWSALKEFASAPPDGDFEYHRIFLDKPDVYRCFYVEKFTGSESYNRPFWSHSVLDTRFLDNLWRESVPFNLSNEYGLAIAHHGSYCWLSSPYGVWRASLTGESLDLTADILSLKQETGLGQGKLTVELRNDDKGYTSLPSPLEIGCQLEISPGYITSQGEEVSPGQAFTLEACEHTSSGGKASLFLYALDRLEQVKDWRARSQFRWNKTSSDMNVKQILEFVLARAGLKLEVKSQSSVVTGYYPDFTIHAGSRGEIIIERLLSFIPDMVFFEGNKAYLVNPLSSDAPVYSYGQTHPVFEGKYRKGAWRSNRIQVEGYDPVGDEKIIKDTFSWNQIDILYDRFDQLEDRNLDTVAKAGQRGEAHLRKIEIESTGGAIRVPVNCGQQLYDVIDITDSRAGLSTEKMRVTGITLIYNPRRGEYEHRLSLGAV